MKNVGACIQCKCEVWIPDALYDAAKASSKISFHCAYGHPMIFREGESEEDRLRRELQRAQQRLAEKDDAIAATREERDAAERRASAARGQVTKLKNRAAKGVCPCCSRHFTNLERHMTTKHPDFSNVVNLEKSA
jgi:hypothetical protein